MDELIQAMSNEELEAIKEKHSDNPSILTLIDGILEGRVKEEAQVQAKQAFEANLAKFVNGVTKKGKPYLPHPEDVHNIYIRWGEVEVEDTEAEPEEVEVVDKDGNKVTEMRKPSHMEYQWIVQVNHAVKVTSGGSDGSPKASKRAITVYKRNGTQLDLKGHYPSASKACEALGLTIGGDSATRVLARDSFIIEPYDGTEFNTS